MMLMILITCGKLSYSRILSMATLSLSRLHIIRTVQLKTKDMRTTKTQTIICTVQMKTTSKEDENHKGTVKDMPTPKTWMADTT